MPLFADVLVDDLPANVTQPIFTYLVPAAFVPTLGLGSRVTVPLGTLQRLGYVVRLHQDVPTFEGLRPIVNILPAGQLSPDFLDWLSWAADYYNESFSHFVTTAIPSGVRGKIQQEIVLNEPTDTLLAYLNTHFEHKPDVIALGTYLLAAWPQRKSLAACKHHFGRNVLKNINILRKQGLVTIETHEVTAHATAKLQLFATFLAVPDKLTKSQQEVMNLLQLAGGYLPAQELARRAQVTPAVLKALEKKGALSLEKERMMRRPLPELNTHYPPVVLTAYQQTALQAIVQALKGEHPSTEPVVLLHGVTGSGKTEVYLQSVSQVLAEGHSALILVPEIALTPLLLARFRNRCGDAVAVLHSGLSDGEYFDEWQRIHNGLARVVIGARSAIFAPLQHVRLIIVDEEHETSFKQEQSLRYDARTLAIERMSRAGGVVVLGSATPRIEDYWRAQSGLYQYLSMPERAMGQVMPPVSVVDMRLEQEHGNPGIFSRQLEMLMRQALHDQMQVILFLNRRGYAACMLCRHCGESPKCPACDVSLTWHQVDEWLKCHYCEYKTRSFERCPHCHSLLLQPFGLGTQRVESVTQRLFPQARVLRMDRDTMGHKDAHFQLLQKFSQGEADILIGTQMVAKGLDFPKVTVVGILAADLALNLPDFRASERTFQLLTQAAGRSGRGLEAGRTVIQTYVPENQVIQCAIHHDYEAFYDQELPVRQIFSYPPFATLVRLIFGDVSQRQAMAVAEQFHKAIEDLHWPEVICLGPTIAPLARIQTLYRVQLLLKCQDPERLKPELRTLKARFQGQVNRLLVDIDPYNML